MVNIYHHTKHKVSMSIVQKLWHEQTDRHTQTDTETLQKLYNREVKITLYVSLSWFAKTPRSWITGVHEQMANLEAWPRNFTSFGRSSILAFRNGNKALASGSRANISLNILIPLLVISPDKLSHDFCISKIWKFIWYHLNIIKQSRMEYFQYPKN